MKKQLVIILILTFAFSPLYSFEIKNDFKGEGEINSKTWNVLPTGTVEKTTQGLCLTSGKGEEIATIRTRKKIHPDDFYKLRVEILPSKKYYDGYSVFVGGPDWMLNCGNNGRYWLIHKGKIFGAVTGANPLGVWYTVEAENRPGLLNLKVKNIEGKVVAAWAVPKDSGLPNSMAVGAIGGSHFKGPRVMHVRNYALNVSDEMLDNLYRYPEEGSFLSSQLKGWKIKGKGKLELQSDEESESFIKAKFEKGGQLIFSFKKPKSCEEIYSIVQQFKIKTEDQSYGIEYAFISENGGKIFALENNLKGSWGWSKKRFYLDLCSRFDNPNEKRISDFQMSLCFVEKPAEVYVKEMYFELFEKQEDKK